MRCQQRIGILYSQYFAKRIGETQSAFCCERCVHGEKGAEEGLGWMVVFKS